MIARSPSGGRASTIIAGWWRGALDRAHPSRPQLTENFISLIASEFTTAPPTRLFA